MKLQNFSREEFIRGFASKIDYTTDRLCNSAEEFIRGFASKIDYTTDRLCFSREEFIRGFAPDKGVIK